MVLGGGGGFIFGCLAFDKLIRDTNKVQEKIKRRNIYIFKR